MKFDGNFTQQEPISEQAIAHAVEIMRSGRLHRYNSLPGELSVAAELEQAYATYQGARYCLACTSGGYGLQIALRAAGLEPGDLVLANAWTLAPVPGAIQGAGGEPVFVEIGDDWLIDCDDLEAKAEQSGAKFLMLSHMRGHIGDMERIVEICARHNITLIEDCAHTMGASYNGIRSGNFGAVAAFSAQTYKHINSGEGGFLTTDDPEIAARAIVHSGSYMLYERHGAAPEPEVFEQVKYVTPNHSGRMDNLRAALLLDQLPRLDQNVERWNARYRALENGLHNKPCIRIVERPQHEAYVGSSFQFHTDGIANVPDFIAACAARGVELKWFGDAEPKAFTSRYDSWRYVKQAQTLPRTLKALSTTCDLRVPLTFSVEDCTLIAAIIAEVAAEHGST